MVEIFNGVDKWGTICPSSYYLSNFDNLASVVCKQLGYAHALAVTSAALDENEEVNVLLGQPFCPDDATSLNDDRCSFTVINVCHCYDRKMFGVICNGKFFVVVLLLLLF